MKDKLLSHIARNITVHRLLETTGEPVIVALSGGADSVALLHSLTSLGYKCVAAHCNYHLRGAESDRDQIHAEDLCKKLSVDILVSHFNVEQYRIKHRCCSVEMACRDLRYEWFARLAEELKAQAIAVGHNADDNIETLLHNLFRGTGISGVRGMVYRNSRNIIRPMLDITRWEIEEYLSRLDIEFITDSSNLTCDYTRNKIRNRLRPEIEAAYPGASEGMTRSLSMLSENESFFRQAVSEKYRQYGGCENAIDLKCLTDKEPYAAMLLFEWFKNDGMSRTQAENIVISADTSGAIFHSSSCVWIINRGVLSKSHDEIPAQSFEQTFDIALHEIGEFTKPADPYSACFDAAVLNGEPLNTRFWKNGDRIRPFGMKGSKKLSDIFSDAKISIDIKSRIPLLTKGETILWIPGIRASAHFPVTADSKRYVTVHYKGILKIPNRSAKL